MQSNLFIPKRIKVGFQEREETYTGKLAYIIYFDEKDKIRKEKSWLSWCDAQQGSFEFDNEPRSGYVFNKGVQRYAYHFGSGRSMLRVYDPRDFEFEITIDNLEAVLMNSDISKKEIMGEYVFAWSGSDLILLPTSSQEYIDSVSYTNKQDKKISTKELIKGATYNRKKNDENYIYIGYYEWFDKENGGLYTKNTSKGKKHIFATIDDDNKVEFEPVSVSLLAECLDEDPVENYPELVIQFEESFNFKKINDFELVDITNDFLELSDESYYWRRKSLIRKDSDTRYTYLSFYADRDIEKQKTNYSGYNQYTIEHYDLVNNIFERLKRTVNRSYGYHSYEEFINDEKSEKELELAVFDSQDKFNPQDFVEKLKTLGFKEFRVKREDGLLYPID